MGVDGCWCAPWSSKPVIVVNSCLGGFDSHILPPMTRRNKKFLRVFFDISSPFPQKCEKNFILCDKTPPFFVNGLKEVEETQSTAKEFLL
jgi:hypothetical protein